MLPLQVTLSDKEITMSFVYFGIYGTGETRHFKCHASVDLTSTCKMMVNYLTARSGCGYDFFTCETGIDEAK